MRGDGPGHGASGPFRGRAVTLSEGLGAEPGLEGGLVPPAGDDQPLVAVVGRLEQLEALEALGLVDRPGASGEPMGQLVPESRGTVMALISMTVMASESSCMHLSSSKGASTGSARITSTR